MKIQHSEGIARRDHRTRLVQDAYHAGALTDWELNKITTRQLAENAVLNIDIEQAQHASDEAWNKLWQALKTREQELRDQPR